MSMPRNRHAKRNSCSREMSAVPREISARVRLVVIGERQPLHRVEIGRADVLQRRLHQPVPHAPHRQAHARAPHRQQQEKPREPPRVERHLVRQRLLQPVERRARNLRQRHLQRDVADEKPHRQRRAEAIAHQERQHAEQIARAERSRFCGNGAHGERDKFITPNPAKRDTFPATVPPPLTSRT